MICFGCLNILKNGYVREGDLLDGKLKNCGENSLWICKN